MEMETETEQPPVIVIPDDWTKAAYSIAYDSTTSPPPVTVVCGAKNCGKSTFSRYLLNTLLLRYKKVVYLDTDVGQPEFTPPGCLSLTVIDEITPDFSIPCLKTPQRSFFFGDISSKGDPTTYLSYIYALCDCYKENTSFKRSGRSSENELPLIVNTSGWLKGIGYDVLVDLLKYIAPTHVVKIHKSFVRKDIPDGAFWLDENQSGTETIIEINSARQDSSNRPVLLHKDPRLMRNLRIMAYFRQCFPSDLNISTIKQLAQALASFPPYQVSISSIKIKHLHCQVPSTEVFYSLNATIVGLAIASEDSEHLPQCVGLGIVRGIDTSKDLLYVITPVPQSSLEKVDLLLQGLVQIPPCLFQVPGCMPAYMSANVLPVIC